MAAERVSRSFLQTHLKDLSQIHSEAVEPLFIFYSYDNYSKQIMHYRKRKGILKEKNNYSHECTESIRAGFMSTCVCRVLADRMHRLPHTVGDFTGIKML